MGTQFKYVGPFDEVELADGTTVKRLEVIEVEPEIAGHREKGSYWLDDEMTQVNPDYDPGSGLYAQPDNWEHVAASKKRDDA